MQTTLAWLQTLRGEDAEAAGTVAAAIALDPSAARPYVIRGLLAARAGRLADAISAWKAARERDPATPNIDTMIDEATRRLAGPLPR